MDFVIAAGVDAEAFNDAAHQRALAWVVWSAIDLGSEAEKLDDLKSLSWLDVIPGLGEALAALPRDFSDPDKYAFLQEPREDLGGRSVTQCLLIGGDAAAAAIRYIDDDLQYD
ncbi:hypothetical protein [Microbacterium lushaniae]|uniref:Uncharacterized protein n=1 Tax=Microbacterium lushaniae TaxID=2614639 RepID=A0A5J6L895_9MICO|nr:hypothetical protein [Microbacterium lushaniae]QEW04640.1 hypothetical protein F6J85_17145 [Microbacterium lushaniae]